MTDSTENNDAAEVESLRQLGASADMGSESSVNEPAEHAAGDGDATTEPSTPAPKAGDESSPTPENKPAEEQQPAAEPPKEPTRYEKAKQREADAWKKINAEKEAIQREREELARLRQQPSAERSPAPTEDHATLAKKARARAKEMRAGGLDEDENGNSPDDYEQFAAQADQKTGQQQSQMASAQFKLDWEKDMEAHMKADADLANRDSEKAKGVLALFREHPYLGRIPGGFSKAVQLLTLQQEAGKVKGLLEENSRHKAEIDRLNKLTGLRGGGPSAPAREKSFEELSDAEQEAQLRNLGANTSLFGS